MAWRPLPDATTSRSTLIWEWPLRAWHWCFAACLCGSLATGLSGDIGLMDWHLRLGYCACGLLLFRLVWGFVGGAYSRWSRYRTSPGLMATHFRGEAPGSSHTAPGIALGVLLMTTAVVQAASGLFSTDDIFIEGPLAGHASDAVVSALTAVHHRAFWVILGLISVHLLANVVYAVRGSRLPLAMITGRKQLPCDIGPTRSLGGRGVALAVMSALLVWGALTLV